MIDRNDAESIFKIADIATKIVDLNHKSTENDFVRMKATALAFVSICGTTEMSDLDMCKMIFETYHEMNRGAQIQETKQ